jgi:hypothetical protein
MRNTSSQQTDVKIVLEAGGCHAHCSDMPFEDLIRVRGEAPKIRAASETGRITAPMQKLTALLQAVHGAGESDQLEFLCASLQKSWNEIHSVAELRILAGWSPQGSTLILVFVRPWTSRCTVEFDASL